MEKSTFIVDFPSKHGDFPVRYVSHYQGVPSTNLQFAHAADCTVAIYLDVEKALAMGIKLFRSSNDVAPCCKNKKKVVARLQAQSFSGA